MKVIHNLQVMMAIAAMHPRRIAVLGFIPAPEEFGWPDVREPRNGLGDREPAPPPPHKERI